MALDEQTSDVLTSSKHASACGRTATDPARILIIDDDAVTRAVITEILCDEGYETIEATTSVHATKIVDALGSELRLVLLDAWHAEESIQFARCLKDRGITTPIVILSDFPDIDPSLAPIGAVNVLTKPLEIDDLLQNVGRFALPVT